MSIHLQVAPSAPQQEGPGASDDRSSSSDEDDDQTWDDWVSDSATKQPTKSLFEDKLLPSVTETLAYDKSTHGFDLDETCTRLCVHPRRPI